MCIVRNASLSKLPSGVRPLIAGLDEIDLLADRALDADAIVHLGFGSHTGSWADAVRVERDLVAAWAGALAGSGRVLLVANGTAFYGSSQGQFLDETAPLRDQTLSIRADALAPVHRMSDARGIELRFASFVYGEAGSVFLPKLIRVARETGHSIYTGDGANRLSAVHVTDAAHAVLHALDATNASGIYHIASDDSPTMADLAAAVAVASGATAVRVDEAEAVRLTDPFMAMFLSLDNTLSSHRIRSETNWIPRAPTSLLWDVAYGSYRSGA